MFSLLKCLKCCCSRFLSVDRVCEYYTCLFISLSLYLCICNHEFTPTPPGPVLHHRVYSSFLLPIFVTPFTDNEDPSSPGPYLANSPVGNQRPIPRPLLLTWMHSHPTQAPTLLTRLSSVEMLFLPGSSSDLPPWAPDLVWRPLCLVSPNPFKTKLLIKKKEEAPFVHKPILVRLSLSPFS